MMTPTLAILGSTGSIGRQALEVARTCGFPVHAIAARSSIELLEAQAREFRPKLVVATDAAAAEQLRHRLGDTDIAVATGDAGLLEAATMPSVSCVVAALVGAVGLPSTLAAIEQGKRIALANKETMVCAGELVNEMAQRYGADIIPVDSEHSAIFQCLQGSRSITEVKRLILTASGGPFYGRSQADLQHVTRAEALRHPNWEMGAKITIDSATLMNKGLEFIEAMRLFHLPPEQISVVIHRESIIHSMVEYCDNGIVAQMGTPDMRLPIQYAITWPERTPGPATPLDLLECPPLTFAPPDYVAFPCLDLALQAAKTGGTATAVLNGANEVAVARFLADEIGFLDIPKLVSRALTKVPVIQTPTLAEILEADRVSRVLAQEPVTPIQ